MPSKANNNREAVVVCARHVVKRPSKRSVLVIIISKIKVNYIALFLHLFFGSKHLQYVGIIDFTKL